MLIRLALAAVIAASPVAASADPHQPDLRQYAADTWRSMAAMVDPGTGLPADKISGDLRTKAKVTSPTNVATYLWSVFAARDIGLIKKKDAAARVGKALDSLGMVERDTPTGQFFNWYDPATLATVHVWPETGDTVYPFASSVDNAWLASALMMVPAAVPEKAAAARALLSGMNFAAYYDPQGRADIGTGLMAGGFWPEQPQGQCTRTGDFAGTGRTVFYTCHNYGSPSETRMVTYVAMALGQVPPEHYYGLYRTFPDIACDWAWQDQKPVGSMRTYQGITLWEGTYGYRGLRYVPMWGGSMFEELMPNLVVPEERWAPNSWGRNHPVFVKGQIEHGLNEAKYGYWGFSPSNDPYGGYREWGVDDLGMLAEGYTSDHERTQTDPGYAGCRDPQPAPTSWGDGVVTPHASFLALRYAPQAARANLAKLKADFDAYGPGGFYDAIAVRSGTVSKFYLALDQGMIMAALGNELAGDDMRDYWATAAVTARIRPVIAPETWDAH